MSKVNRRPTRAKAQRPSRGKVSSFELRLASAKSSQFSPEVLAVSYGHNPWASVVFWSLGGVFFTKCDDTHGWVEQITVFVSPQLTVTSRV